MTIRLLVQLAPFALLTCGIAVCAWIFVSLKKEIHALARLLGGQQREIANLEERLTSQLAALQEDLRQTEERTGVLVAPTPPRSGLNLSKRSQVLKLSRHGETAENIAAALSLPRKEVELLLKVQKIVLVSAAQAAS